MYDKNIDDPYCKPNYYLRNDSKINIFQGKFFILKIVGISH